MHSLWTLAPKKNCSRELFLRNKRFKSQAVGIKTKPRDASFAFRCYQRNMTVFFPCKNIGNVHFNHRAFYSSYSICNSHRSMCVATGIQNNSVITEAYFMQFINDFSFHIVLKIFKLEFREIFLQQ